MSEFEAIIAAHNQAVEHNQEILSSRVGGFGGSDAKLFYTIGTKGLDSLSNTDLKRIAVAMGLTDVEDHIDNMYTRAGHSFEDFMSLPLASWNREEVMESNLAKNFRTFAHADFYKPDEKRVAELKYSQHTTPQVIQTYQYQLQWYFMLGAEKVSLVHGWGEVEPFNVEGTENVVVLPNERQIFILKKGIQVLDEAISNGWQPAIKDVEDMPKKMQALVKRYLQAKRHADDYTAKANELKAQIQSLAETGGATAFQGEFKNGEIHIAQLVTRAGNRTFDSKKFLKDHPEFDLECYYKQGASSTNIQIK